MLPWHGWIGRSRRGMYLPNAVMIYERCMAIRRDKEMVIEVVGLCHKCPLGRTVDETGRDICLRLSEIRNIEVLGEA